MKTKTYKCIFSFFIIFSNLFFGQNQIEVDSLKMIFEPHKKDLEIYRIYDRAKFQFDSLKLYDARIILREKRKEDFKLAYSKLLYLTDYTSVNVQNALLKNYLEKYKEQPLKFKFNNKEEVEKKIGLFDEAFTSSLAILYLKNIQIHYKKYEKEYEQYIDKNLKRLNISKNEFENLSDSDKELLWKEFR